MTPRLPGASRVQFRLTNPRHADLGHAIGVVEDGWEAARRKLRGLGWPCACGRRENHLMNGVEVLLLDRSPYIARCWDDDRVWINVHKLAQERRPDQILVHEFGHRVWFGCLNGPQQAQWRRSADRARSDRRVVSDYARTDEIEDFAEVFRALVYGEADRYTAARWKTLCGGRGCSSR